MTDQRVVIYQDKHLQYDIAEKLLWCLQAISDSKSETDTYLDPVRFNQLETATPLQTKGAAVLDKMPEGGSSDIDCLHRKANGEAETRGHQLQVSAGFGHSDTT